MEVSMKLKLTLVTLTAAVLGASSAALLAEDAGQVKVDYDKAAAERTNMPSREGDEPGNLTVTFDPAFTDRTNMKRTPEEPKPVTISRDKAWQERTNMLGSQPQTPASQTAAAPK
jgi:hypothetical protein